MLSNLFLHSHCFCKLFARNFSNWENVESTAAKFQQRRELKTSRRKQQNQVFRVLLIAIFVHRKQIIVIDHFQVAFCISGKLKWVFVWNIHMKTSFTCMSIVMQIQLIFMWYVLHDGSLWNRGKMQLRNGLSLSLISDFP